MQAADVVPSGWNGLREGPNASGLVSEASAQGGVPNGQFRAHGVVPAHLASPPTSPLGLARYSGAGPDLWLASCHGGAGASTLAAVIPRSMSSGRYWPTPELPGQAQVLLVARSHAAGLCAAQAAARQWAAGVLPNVRLLGLAVVADAPGKRPRPLKDLLNLISGGVPHVWDLPWVEALRLGDTPEQTKLPSAYRRLVQDMHRILSENAHD
jgi:hypothetical protein